MKRGHPKQDNGLFGNIFDLNGDGKTGALETAMLFAFLEELEQEEKATREKTAAGSVMDLDDTNIEEI